MFHSQSRALTICEQPVQVWHSPTAAGAGASRCRWSRLCRQTPGWRQSTISSSAFCARLPRTRRRGEGLAASLAQLVASSDDTPSGIGCVAAMACQLKKHRLVDLQHRLFWDETQDTQTQCSRHHICTFSGGRSGCMLLSMEEVSDPTCTHIAMARDWSFLPELSS